ncbi:hypothetical protein IMCC20628_02393 [Hoeflea sp. IMCC20628]|uniref:hypothetical protein n=1 Tax=Hoeflea sp. IMCC20628 TaxID=1620421 RepID=UPI00063ADE5C|nr:hypothetical protein [Hoeflea sp. IMCC20628]AKI01091.1 hypothetical protein IMCC20628_02393 [Hoeflea sp. IMCC20628]
MNFHPRFMQKLFVSSVLGFALASPALALDADDFATKVAAVASQGGVKMSFASVEPDGDTIVLKSARFEAPGEPPVDIGNITFNGVEDENDGSYYVDQMQFDDVNITKDGVSVSVVDIEMSGLTVPADPVYDTIDNIMFYEGFSTGKIRVQKDRKEVFSMAGLNLEVDRADDDSSVSMVMDGSDMAIDLSQIDDAKAKEALSELGYTKLTGDLKLDGVWEVEPGTFSLREYSLSLDDIGQLAMSLEISGYTLEFIKAMQQAQAAAAANPDPEAAQQAMGFAMLGMLQQLSFKSAAIRFDDASVTEKALTFAGKKQGMSGDQMRMAIKGMMPLMLGQLGLPALQQQILAATNIYLDNPGNITISAKPANPVAVPVIMGAGMGDPKTLVDLLNVQVTANDPVVLCCKE